MTKGEMYMPGFDGTGPAGMGPLTGGGRGYCAVPLTGSYRPYQDNGFANYMPVSYAYPYGGFRMRRYYPFVFGRGCGRGFARRRWLW
jgi:hypothetical protein